MTRVLLVTGSRSLAKIPGADAWGRALIRTALDGVDLLIVGDALGPDLWASIEATMAAVESREYISREPHEGMVATFDRGGLRTMERWAPHGASTHPLRRNEAMVRDAASLAAQGADVRCLALIDGTKRDTPGKRATRGTEHTAALAERAGILVMREVWG